MNQIIQDLSEICEEYRFQDKLVFIPSYAVGHRIGEGLAKEGHSWINLRFTTVLGFAQGLVVLELVQEGTRLIDARERLLIVEEIFRRDEDLDGSGAYFKGASEATGS